VTYFEEELNWVMAHINELEVQDLVDFVTANRNELMTLHPAHKKSEPNTGWLEAKRLEAEINASPFGKKIQAWVDSLPDETGPEDPELAEHFESIVTEPLRPSKPPVAAPVVVPDPPSPPAPSTGWQSLNFQTDPKRAKTNEPGRINKWQAGKPSPPTGWESDSRPYLDS
jgi:hypothetical protein